MRAIPILTLALSSLAAGCAVQDEETPIELSNGSGKSDGEAYLEINLTKTHRTRFTVPCKEYFSCDITIGAAPTADVYSKIDSLLKTARTESFPIPVVQVKASGIAYEGSLDLVLEQPTTDPRIDSGGPISQSASGAPVFYEMSVTLPPAGARDNLAIDLMLPASLPFDEGEFRVVAFWE